VTDFESATGAEPPVVQTPISTSQAARATHQDAIPQFDEFIRSLQMARPVSTDKAAELLEHLVKLQMASDDVRIADQMRDDGWEADLLDGESLTVLGERAFAYLATPEGLNLFNLIVKTYAKTIGSMFD
jgi:hypothetical protein